MSFFNIQSFKLQYQLSPIILTGGSASNISGGIPILALSDSLSFTTSILGGNTFSGDSAFANFQPLAHSTLVSQSVAKYPFANQSVAANATIRNPLSISMLMMTPNKNPASFQATMTALKSTFDNHNNSGGTYTVMTPAYSYPNCLMLDFTDASTANSVFPQNAWIIEFERPLVALQDLAVAQNQMMSQITNGLFSTGQTSGASISGQGGIGHQ